MNTKYLGLIEREESVIRSERACLAAGIGILYFVTKAPFNGPTMDKSWISETLNAKDGGNAVNAWTQLTATLR
ncbi:hypothetical protein [Shewanella woodyi]|uniref:hypothetical protein n=1 Tax=Shewanella woodyi TaxID=60961 RepID=UPI003748D469